MPGHGDDLVDPGRRPAGERLGYLGLAAACLLTCALIVVFFGGYPLVRGVLGDVVIVMLLYFLL